MCIQGILVSSQSVRQTFKALRKMSPHLGGTPQEIANSVRQCERHSFSQQELAPTGGGFGAAPGAP